MKTQEYYIKCDEIIEQGVCTEDELSIAVRFGGASMETLEKLIKYKKEVKKTYICKTTIAIRVEAEDETEAEELASLEMDIGDIDWEAEEVIENNVGDAITGEGELSHYVEYENNQI